MLDDLKYIHERDAQDALGIAEKQWQQYTYAFKFNWKPARPVRTVVIAGMGGSGLAATAFKVWPGLGVPLEIVHDYELPKSIDQNTLVICSSYSGNTEETLSCLTSALNDENTVELQPMVVVVAAGGKLINIAQEKSLPYIKLPEGYQPRMTFGYQLRALIEIFEQASLVNEALPQLTRSAEWLKDQLNSWLPTVPSKDNKAKQLALKCMGKSPVIYAGPKLFPAAYKWKISFNENAKNVAWCNQIPEFNHNEMLGWTSHPTEKPYAIIDLRSNLEHPGVQKRFEVTERLLSGKRPAAHIIEVQGQSLIDQLLWAIALGDFVSLYTALLNGLNPTPVDLIEKFKKSLEE
jgi:glucose/mannose-6-phosphate isomerase